jgi:two-component system, OmpR family, KDP operon response regulator KdpE
MPNAERVMTHRQILTAIWGPAHAEDMQYLRVLIGQLRGKLEDDHANPSFIWTEPGIGYRIAVED